MENLKRIKQGLLIARWFHLYIYVWLQKARYVKNLGNLPP